MRKLNESSNDGARNSMNSLRERLASGQFVVTTEMEPPKGTDLSHLLSTAAFLKGRVHAVNVTDNQRAMMRLSSVGGASVLVREGLEPILQVTCRDRNRMALQSDLLTAWVLGIRNILTMTGDPVEAGDHPLAKPVFDVSSADLLRLIEQLNSGRDGAGHPLEGKPDFFCGATVNPGMEPLEPELRRFEEKVAAGARFFQTQAIYDLEAFARFMDLARTMPVYIIAGLIPLRSARMAHFLNEKVPGIHVPADVTERLKKSKDPVEAGLEIAGELVGSLSKICHGIHLMVVGKKKDFTILERLSLADSSR
jgi:methylenetetrahydrofolate reductase (NADPH)